MNDPLAVAQTEDIEALLRVVRRRTPLIVLGAVLTVLAIAVATFAVVLTHDADEQIHALSAEAAANQRQAQQFQAFLQKFVAEENYVCSVVAASAVRDGMPPPPKSVCAVVPPAPRPLPTPSPTPSPVPAPAAAAGTAAPQVPAAPATGPVAAPLPPPPPRQHGCEHSVRPQHCG